MWRTLSDLSLTVFAGGFSIIIGPLDPTYARGIDVEELFALFVDRLPSNTDCVLFILEFYEDELCMLIGLFSLLLIVEWVLVWKTLAWNEFPGPPEEDALKLPLAYETFAF